MIAAQAAFEADPSPISRTSVNRIIAHYILILKMEEDFWRQKASLKWLSEGGQEYKVLPELG